MPSPRRVDAHGGTDAESRAYGAVDSGSGAGACGDGALVTLTTLGIVFERRRDGETPAAIGKAGAWVGTRIYTPALFAVLGFGIAMIEKGGLGRGRFWIDFALAGWTVAVVGVGFVGPELGRIDRAAQANGPDSEEVRARVARLFTVFRFEPVLLMLIVLDMAAKPSF